jgi:hypothetical protein
LASWGGIGFTDGSQRIKEEGMGITIKNKERNHGGFMMDSFDTVDSHDYIDVVLSNLTVDIDHYVRAGRKPDLINYDCQPYSSGTTTEACTLENTGATSWFIGVQGYQAGAYDLSLTLMCVPELTSGAPQDSSVTQGVWSDYQISSSAFNTDIEVLFDENYCIKGDYYHVQAA